MSNPQVEELREKYKDNIINYDEIGMLFRIIDTLGKILDDYSYKSKYEKTTTQIDVDKIKVIAQQEIKKSIMENFDSAFIFTYVQSLEIENKELKAKLKGKNF